LGRFWFSATASSLGDDAGIPRFSFVAEDITERKKNEAQLRRSNEELRRANQDLEQFAYSASHDLQEPLRQVAIYSQLLAAEYSTKLDGNALEYLLFSVEGAQRMQMLVRDLLAYSQAAKSVDGSGVTDPADALEGAKQNLSAAIRESGATINCGSLPCVPVPRAPLVHVFQNLLSNALKYRKAEPPCVEIWADRQGDFWRFAVRDHGIGIPRQYHQQIFGIFKRLHDRSAYPGTGIGLAICQKVVERLGGAIWVDSDEGEGATFYFTLPAA
jgi:light-regulated signal transduction histidine kinase (bacteriophytochrome)